LGEPAPVLASPPNLTQTDAKSSASDYYLTFQITARHRRSKSNGNKKREASFPFFPYKIDDYSE